MEKNLTQYGGNILLCFGNNFSGLLVVLRTIQCTYGTCRAKRLFRS